MRQRLRWRVLIWILLAPLLLIGCNADKDARLADLARQSLAQQATQNDAMARQSQEIAEAAHKMVEAEGQARQDLIGMQDRLQTQLQTERGNIDRQREDLEQDRRQIAQQRHRDPIVAAAIMQATMIVVAALPLILAIVLLLALRNSDSNADLGDLLVEDLAAKEPLVLSGYAARRLEQSHPVALIAESPPPTEDANLMDTPPF